MIFPIVEEAYPGAVAHKLIARRSNKNDTRSARCTPRHFQNGDISCHERPVRVQSRGLLAIAALNLADVLLERALNSPNRVVLVGGLLAACRDHGLNVHPKVRAHRSPQIARQPVCPSASSCVCAISLQTRLEWVYIHVVWVHKTVVCLPL